MIRFILYISALILHSVSVFSQVQREDITLMNGPITLSGTLSFTETTQPLVIWVHGSGNIDRNGTQKGLLPLRYIQKCRDSLNARGLAFFSYDKRTANSANKDLLKTTLFDDLVTDLQIVVDHLKKEKRFSKIVLIGHSQGSLVAMLGAKNSDKIISLAGPASPIQEIIVQQIAKNAAILAPFAKKHFEELEKTGTIKEINPMLMNIFAKPMHAFLRSWMHYHPTKVARTLQQPLLIIQGEKDLQVAVRDAQLLKDAVPKATLVVIKNMNHVLKTIQKDSDNMTSYTDPSFPLSVTLVNAIVKFVKQP